MLFRYASVLVSLIFILPAMAGLAGILFPAMGYFPILEEARSFDFSPFHQFWVYPGAVRSIFFSFITGFSATAISFTLVIAFFAFCHDTLLDQKIRRFFSPLLSVPHVTIAIGLAFVLAPSGWIARAISPELTGWVRPPTIATSPDPFGLLFVFALIIKETPFLFLMVLSALNQTSTKKWLSSAQSLGYSPPTAWLKTVLPHIYQQITLPLYAVLVFSVSVVDVALILAPSRHPLLSIQILRWYNDPDLSFQLLAAAGAVIQAGLCIFAILFLRTIMKTIALFARRFFFESGNRKIMMEKTLRFIVIALVILIAVSSFLSIANLAIWSFADRWRYPAALPQEWHLENWSYFFSNLTQALFNSLILAGSAAIISLVLVISCLEAENRYALTPGEKVLWLVYLPLLIPQIAFLFGTQILLFIIDAQTSWAALIWGHILFVLPYCFLSLSDFWRKLDSRYRYSALCMGISPNRVLLCITLPLLLRPLLISFALSFAVGLAQYLPVVFLGAGRVATLTSEAIIAASGGDRRFVGVYGFLQTALPAIAFILSTALPKWLYRNRKNMKIGAE